MHALQDSGAAAALRQSSTQPCHPRAAPATSPLLPQPHGGAEGPCPESHAGENLLHPQAVAGRALQPQHTCVPQPQGCSRQAAAPAPCSSRGHTQGISKRNRPVLWRRNCFVTPWWRLGLTVAMGMASHCLVPCGSLGAGISLLSSAQDGWGGITFSWRLCFSFFASSTCVCSSWICAMSVADWGNREPGGGSSPGAWSSAQAPEVLHAHSCHLPAQHCLNASFLIFQNKYCRSGQHPLV